MAEATLCDVCRKPIEVGLTLRYTTPESPRLDYCSVECLLTFVLEMQRVVDLGEAAEDRLDV